MTIFACEHHSNAVYVAKHSQLRGQYHYEILVLCQKDTTSIILIISTLRREKTFKMTVGALGPRIDPIRPT